MDWLIALVSRLQNLLVLLTVLSNKGVSGSGPHHGLGVEHGPLNSCDMDVDLAFSM